MPQKSLIQQVKTRWNSLYFMVSRILVNITSLNPLLINETKNKNDIIDQSERKMLEDACSVLQNFHEVTKLFSGEKYVTSDVIIPSFLKLKQITNVDDNMSDEFINLFKKILNIEIEIYCLRYDIFEKKHLMASTFLNSKFKKLPLAESVTDRTSYINKAIDFFSKLSNTLVPNGESSSSINKENKKDKNKNLNLSDSSDDENDRFNLNKEISEYRYYIK